MALSSAEVNYLVYRYLQESGFTHASFTFAYESMVCKSDFSEAAVPPGALLTFLQKGLMYMELEAHAQQDGSEKSCEEPFSLMYPHTCKVSAEPRKTQSDDDKMTNADESPTLPIEIAEEDVSVLTGHSSEVFICSWNPQRDMLATGSGDSTARVWEIPNAPCSTEVGEASSDRAVVLSHQSSKKQDAGSGELDNQKSDRQRGATDMAGSASQHPDAETTLNKDVTTLDWNFDGTKLATGSYDGCARIWNKGLWELQMTLSKHSGPIFALKWNQKGTYLLSGSVDKTTIVWDAKTGEPKQQFSFHHAPVLDVDWKDNSCFASCSTDKLIMVCKMGDDQPLTTFEGHKDEVNTIQWDPTGTLLASCSDDFTAKIWRIKQEHAVHSFNEHKKEIYAVRWSPTGPGSEYPTKQPILASASFDHTVKLWDVETGTCLHTLDKHSFPVYSVSFSPDGEYLASGSYDRSLYIWAVKDGQLVRTFRGGGGIFEVCWNNSGTKVAACYSNKTVCVIDFKR